MKPNRRNPLFSNFFRSNTLTTAIVVSLGSSAVQAADVFWDRGSATNAWATAGNWSATDTAAAATGALPGTGDVAVFNITALVANQTIDMGADRTIAGMSFTTSGTVLIQGGGANRTLNLGGSGITKSGTGAITIGNTTTNQNANVRLTADQTWANNNDTGAIIVRNSVAASTAVARTLTLGGSSTAANNVSGVDRQQRHGCHEPRQVRSRNMDSRRCQHLHRRVTVSVAGSSTESQRRTRHQRRWHDDCVRGHPQSRRHSGRQRTESGNRSHYRQRHRRRWPRSNSPTPAPTTNKMPSKGP